MSERPLHEHRVLRLNAWTGEEAASAPLDLSRAGWTARPQPDFDAAGDWRLGTRRPAWDWRAYDVGWGLVLPDRPDEADCAQLATAYDAPEPIQRLVAARENAPVFRWRPDDTGIGELVRYWPDGHETPLALAAHAGRDDHELPRFLLIHASPEQIPWAFQYIANVNRYVGRLWFDEEQPLHHYVAALLDDWAGSTCDLHAPVLWSVDHGEPDITHLMHRYLASHLQAAWRDDHEGDFARHTPLFGDDATRDRLVQALVAKRPGLIVTSSHGMTGPLHDPAAMRRQLGSPVDVAHRVLDLDALCAQWEPDGAVWYSHACCAAGSDAVSAYDGLFDRTSNVGRVLAGVAGCGARIAPLPQRLLGARRPLRAFIGHVEPTFDWTLSEPTTGQRMTGDLVKCLYEGLHSHEHRLPIGHAMNPLFGPVGTLLSQRDRARQQAHAGNGEAAARALHFEIAAVDRQHTVILGDPVAALPRLTGCR